MMSTDNMSEETLKKKTAIGVIWSIAERFSVQLVQLVVMLVIARILEPKDFGLIGMLTIFIAVAQSLVDSGFSQALIRKIDRTEIDNSTVFYFNIVISILLYVVFYIIAPWVADFYNEPQLQSLMRVLCLIIIINSFAVVQRAIFSAKVDFHTQANASIIGAVISGGLGLYFAYNGYGVWTLVFQQLLNAFTNTCLLWMYSNWHPKLIFSWNSFKEMFSFGSKIMVSGLLDTFYVNAYSLVIGKVFTAESLGQYTQANRFAEFPSSNITSIFQRVTFPVLCDVQTDKERLISYFRRFLKLFSFVIFPSMCLLASISYPLINILIGEKWRFASALMIPLCFTLMWWPIHALNLNLLKVIGRSDVFLKLEIIKKIIGVFVLAITLPFGVLFMCYFKVLSTFIGLYINTYYTGKILGVGLKCQMHDIAHNLLASLVMFAIVLSIQFLFESDWLQLIVGILIGVVFWLGVAYMFHFKELEDLLSISKLLKK